MSSKDTLFSKPHDAVKPFEFNERVAAVFEDMISRSVPGYHAVLELMPTLVHTLLDRSNEEEPFTAYDLGCSLGAAMLAVCKAFAHPEYQTRDARIIGVDMSPAMINRANQVLEDALLPKRIVTELVCGDICSLELFRCDIVVLHYTLQFVPLALRDALLNKIYTSLKPGGACVVSEKVAIKNEHANALITEIHHRFKRDQGYSELEVAQKRDAIEKVLIPETIDTHLERLKNVGFKVVHPWINNLQFVSILAIK